MITEKVKVANGKNEDAQKVNLRELLGLKERNPFGVSDKKKFEEMISSLPMVDLQQMAVKAGISVSGNITTIRDNLRKEFANYTARNAPLYAKPAVDNSVLLAKVKAIMAT